jgi:hypothetical protein
MPKICISQKQAARFSNGGQLDLNRIKFDGFNNGEIYRVYCEQKFLGLGQADTKENILKIECLVDRWV